MYNLKPLQVEVSARRVNTGGSRHLCFSHNYSNRSQKTCFYNKHPPSQKTHFCHRWQFLKGIFCSEALELVPFGGNYDGGMILSNWETMTQSTSLLAWSTVWKIRVEIVILLKFFPSISLRILLKYLAISKSRHHEILIGPQRSEEPNKLTKLEDVMSG